MIRTREPHGLVDSLRDQAADCLRQANFEKQPKNREALISVARSYLKIANSVEKRLPGVAGMLPNVEVARGRDFGRAAQTDSMQVSEARRPAGPWIEISCKVASRARRTLANART